MLNPKQTALATRCLWSLQEAAPEIEGLLLTQVNGLTLTTTLPGDDRTQRVAAVATAMFLLGEHTSEAWGNGESLEVSVGLTGSAQARRITIKPVGYEAVLISLHQPGPRTPSIDADLNQAVRYLNRLIKGQLAPPPQEWHSR